MRFVWLSEETVTIALYIINGLIFITEVESVYCAIRTEFLYKTDKCRSERVNWQGYFLSKIIFSQLNVTEHSNERPAYVKHRIFF